MLPIDSVCSALKSECSFCSRCCLFVSGIYYAHQTNRQLTVCVQWRWINAENNIDSIKSSENIIISTYLNAKELYSDVQSCWNWKILMNFRFKLWNCDAIPTSWSIKPFAQLQFTKIQFNRFLTRVNQQNPWIYYSNKHDGNFISSRRLNLIRSPVRWRAKITFDNICVRRPVNS